MKKNIQAKNVHHLKTLANGLRIITIPMNNPTVTVLVLVEAGSKYETKSQNGISHFLEHMCFKGTTKRPSPSGISLELDTLGAQHNAFTSQEYTGYYAKGRATQTHTLIDIVADLYLNPSLPQDEIEKEKGVICDEINMYEDMPTRKVYELFQELLYGNQPAGWTIAGSKEQVKKYKQKDFIKYREAHYVAEATTIIVAGQIDEKKVIADITKQFKNISTAKKTKKVKVVEKQSKTAIKIKFKKSDQSHIMLGFRTFDTYHKDNSTMAMLSGVLGAGMSSRLFRKVREEMGCGYYVGAYHDTTTDTGVLTLRAGVTPKRTPEVVEALLNECKRLTVELVSEEELAKVREIASGGLFMGLESSDAVAEFIGSQAIMHKEVLSAGQIEEKLLAVSSKDIMRLAKKVFHAEKLNLAIIGPHKSDKDFAKACKSLG